MKHAIMVIGHGDKQVLQETINLMDDKDIDFFIHWDKKFPMPKLHSKNSKIYFINRIRLFWGTDTQVIVEHNLLLAVYESGINYDYVHLISSSDIPLMTKEYFKSYFSADVYIAFVDNVTDEIRNRIQWYYPFKHVNVRSRVGAWCILKPVLLFNRIFKIRRMQNSKIIQKGANWFSVRGTLVKEIVLFKDFKIFLHSYLADELYIQTILHRYKPQKCAENDNEMALRYIDWNRGGPYTFNIDDTRELSELVNTKYAFARKVTDPRIMKKIFSQ